MDTKYLEEPCWCCGTPRAVFHNDNGTREEFCLGRSEMNKDRCVPPCKYLSPAPAAVVWCNAEGRTDGNCRGTLKGSRKIIKRRLRTKRRRRGRWMNRRDGRGLGRLGRAEP